MYIYTYIYISTILSHTRQLTSHFQRGIEHFQSQTSYRPLAFGPRFADMLFVETLRLSGYSYEWSKRKIHPLFQETGKDCSGTPGCEDGEATFDIISPSTNRWMDGWLAGWMDRWMDGWMDATHTHIYMCGVCVYCMYLYIHTILYTTTAPPKNNYGWLNKLTMVCLQSPQLQITGDLQVFFTLISYESRSLVIFTIDHWRNNHQLLDISTSY